MLTVAAPELNTFHLDLYISIHLIFTYYLNAI